MWGNNLIPDKKNSAREEKDDGINVVKKPKIQQKITFQEKLVKGPLKKEKHKVSVNDILDELEEDDYDYGDDNEENEIDEV
jgi:hypothetical protein